MPSTWPPSPKSDIPPLLAGVYYDKKRAEGQTKKEALRALKRRVSDTVYQHLVADQK